MNNHIKQSNVVTFPIARSWTAPAAACIRKQATDVMAGMKVLEMGQESEYAQMLCGIYKGDLMFVDPERKPTTGELVIGRIGTTGKLDLDTYDEDYPTSGLQGVLVGVLKLIDITPSQREAIGGLAS